MSPETRTRLSCILLHLFIRSALSISFEGAYFDKIAFHKSDGNSIQTTDVHDIFQCVWSCLRLPECLSLNIADQPNKDGLYECVLLRNKTSESSGLLGPSQVYHHYTRSKDYCAAQSIPLGMESGYIDDQRITASSIFSNNYTPGRARLGLIAENGKASAWAAGSNNENQWLQVDLTMLTTVTYIATQGSPHTHVSEWVTSYSLQYSMNYKYFVDYEGGKIFTGNSDRNTKVKHALEPAIIARYIRVRPKTWNNHIALRMELYGCR